MKLLLDTHYCFWFAVRPERLSDAERRALDAAQERAFSAASIWELRLKWEKRHASGERKGPVDPHDVLEALVLRGLRELSITGTLAAMSLDPPLAHSDPFDLLLLTQAHQGGYRLLTRDEKMTKHPAAMTVR